MAGGFAGGADGFAEFAPGQVCLAGGVDGLGEFFSAAARRNAASLTAISGGSGASKSSGLGSWFSNASARRSALAMRSAREGRIMITVGTCLERAA